MIMPENIPVLGVFFQVIDEILEHVSDGFQFSVFGFEFINKVAAGFSLRNGIVGVQSA